MTADHIAGVMATRTGPRENRVTAVLWEACGLDCDGKHLDVETTGWLWCPSPGCRWQSDPEAKCPEHGQRGDA